MSEFVWQSLFIALVRAVVILISMGAIAPALATEATSAAPASNRSRVAVGSSESKPEATRLEPASTDAQDLLSGTRDLSVSSDTQSLTFGVTNLDHSSERSDNSAAAPSSLPLAFHSADSVHFTPFASSDLADRSGFDQAIELTSSASSHSSEPVLDSAADASIDPSIDLSLTESSSIASSDSSSNQPANQPANQSNSSNQPTAPGSPPPPGLPPSAPVPAPHAGVTPSTALNILVLRALKKPVGNRVLDSGVQSAGIRPRAPGDNFWTRDYLTGYWGGTRTSLYQHGIDLYLVYFAEVYSNVAGGLEQATAYNSVAVGGIDFYTGRMGLWQGGQLHITAAWLEGTSVGRNYAGALNSTFFGDPVEHGPRLFELWYGQRFDHDRGEVRVGKIYPFVRIAPSQVAGIFTNGSFGYPAFLGSSPNGGLSVTYPVAPFGVQLSYTFDPHWSIIGQIQDGFEDPSGGYDNRSSLSIGLSGTEGIEGIFETVYKLNQAPGDTGLPGNYRVGVQFHTGRFFDNHENEAGDPLAVDGGHPQTHWGDSAFYFVADQMLVQESKAAGRTQGLSAFLKAIYSPNQDVNTISMNLAGGLAYEGPFPGRDRDVIGLAASYTRISDGLREYWQDQGQERDAETVIEFVYTAEIAPWWMIVGSVQHIIHPSGNPGIPDATVLGFSSRFSF
jgi:porin